VDGKIGARMEVRVEEKKWMAVRVAEKSVLIRLMKPMWIEREKRDTTWVEEWTRVHWYPVP